MPKSPSIRVVALHKLPFDPQRFEEQVAQGAPSDARELAAYRQQVRDTWDNAWIVVIEADEAKVDFGKFAHPRPGPQAQAAYDEQVLEQRPGRLQAAFFLHYVDPAAPLWYADQQFAFPTPTPVPHDLLERMPYSAPD